MIYTDKKAPPAIRNQAQSLIVMLTQGLGLGHRRPALRPLGHGMLG